MTTSPNKSSDPAASAKKTSRWVLYHGTSTLRLQSILRENRLRGEGSGPTVSFTTDLSVAEYFACRAVAFDEENYAGSDPDGVVLTIDGERLLHEERQLFAPISELRGLGAVAKEWDPHNWDFENELLLEEDLAPLSPFLIDTIPIKKSTYDRYRQHGRPAFMPRVPFAAGVELVVMERLLQWDMDEPPEEAKSWTHALRAIRDALTLLRQSKHPSGGEGKHDA
jgi:hypothetical protein